MFCYRYRQGDEISIKELMYNEMFFSSTAECNDPTEGNFFAIFDNNVDYWERLIDISVGKKNADIHRTSIKKLANYFAEKSPISVHDFLSIQYDDSYLKNFIDPFLFEVILGKMSKKIKLYAPAEHYFVSFSKNNDNFLMWSHYANKHQGFCLIFRPIDNKIYQDKKRLKTSFDSCTPNSFAPRMSFSIPNGFTLRPVEYTSNPQSLNAFMCMPEYVCGDDYSEEEKKSFRTKFDKTYLIKNLAWKYEEEFRILLSSGVQWLAGDILKLSVQQRLFHYESSQLAGIIFGARMLSKQRERIIEIIQEKIAYFFHDDSKSEKTFSDFMLFEEKITNDERKIVVKPVEIITDTSSIKPENATFQERYIDWQDGWALKFCENGCKRVKLE